jgi:CubicO group peptidase (beta-lactamase class C family)
MTRRVQTMLIAVALLALPVVAQALTAQPSAARADQTAIDRANEQTRVLLQARMAEQHIPGLQVAVVVGGRVVMSEAYGVADIEQQLAATRATLFPINSATKSFTGVAIMQLVEDGRVDLEAPISRYLSDLPTAWREVRIRQLLAHTSGLPNIVDEHGLVGGGTEAEAWAKVQTLPMEAVPGAGFAYNQTNYVLLGRLIEAVSGQPFDKFLAENQFGRATMGRARFGDGYDIVPGRTAVYIRKREGREGDGLYHWIDDIPVSTRAGAGLYTTADDLAKWIIALEDGRLLKKPASLGDLWRPDRLNDGKANIWAMGWPILAGTTHRAVGGIGGGRSTFFIYPDDGVAVIVLTNMVGANPQNLVDKIAGHYVGAGLK